MRVIPFLILLVATTASAQVHFRLNNIHFVDTLHRVEFQLLFDVTNKFGEDLQYCHYTDGYLECIDLKQKKLKIPLEATFLSSHPREIFAANATSQTKIVVSVNKEYLNSTYNSIQVKGITFRAQDPFIKKFTWKVPTIDFEEIFYGYIK